MTCLLLRLSIVLVLVAAFEPLAALEIRDVRVSRAAFEPAQGESIDIRFHIDQPATVRLEIYDGRDLLVREASQSFEPGEQTLNWDGKDDQGRVVPDEAYRFVLQATTPAGESQRHDLSDLTGGERLEARDVTWHPHDQLIHYSLPETARVNIRIGLKDNGPLLRTLVDWVPRPAGPNADAWEGWDASRVLDLSGHPKLSIFVDAYSLSDNTLLVGNPPRQVAFVDIPEDQRQQREKQPPRKRLMHYHHQQPLETRGDIAILVNLPNDLAEDENGVPIVHGQVPIRLDVPAAERTRVLERRFEPVFFVDGTFAFENEVGYLPFTWRLNSDELNPGIHYVTVNLRGYEGNFGMATLKIRVPTTSKDPEAQP